MNSQVVKRSILLAGHKTSVSLEERISHNRGHNEQCAASQEARANVHRHGSNYSLATTASSARILWCLNASANR
jgi:predicted DNA-binding ribbon-helix-helix protein